MPLFLIAAGGSLLSGWACHTTSRGSETLPERIFLALFAQLTARTWTQQSKGLKTLNSQELSFRTFSYKTIHRLALLPSLKGRRQKEIPNDMYKKEKKQCYLQFASFLVVFPLLNWISYIQLGLSFVISDTLGAHF